MFAGLSHARGDAVIPIDVDLQDPVEVIPQLIAAWEKGAEIVLAKRIDRQSDSFLKRESAKLFYKLHNKISSPRIEPDVGDFRLLDRSVVDIIKNMPERNIFMKGILSWCGGRTVIVPYARPKTFCRLNKIQCVETMESGHRGNYQLFHAASAHMDIYWNICLSAFPFFTACSL